MIGEDIVKAVMAEYKIGKYDLFKSKFPEHVRIRSIAIKRLGNAGLNLCQIGRAMQCDRATARYWTKPETRQRQRTNRIMRWHESRAHENRTLS